MTRKPTHAAGYAPALAEEARGLCLYLSTILGDLSDDFVVIGGLVPYLIVDQSRVDVRPHVGTRDLDLGLSIGVLDLERYKEISARLRDRGFYPNTNPTGHTTRQTWRHPATDVTVDFLIAPSGPESIPGRLQALEPDFAAIITPALPLAFADSLTVTIDGTTPTGERAKRDVRVCGPAAFVVLKAFALRLRGENKDAYDLVYILENYASGVSDVAARFERVSETTEAQQALRYLTEDFASAAHLGPKRRASFIAGSDDDLLQAEAFALVATFLGAVRVR